MCWRRGLGDHQDGDIGELEKVFGLASDVGLARAADVGSAHDDDVGSPVVRGGQEHIERLASIGGGDRRGDTGIAGEGSDVAENRVSVGAWFNDGDEVELSGVSLGEFNGQCHGGQSWRRVIDGNQHSVHHGRGVPLWLLAI
jgi:hypothetical protein